MKSPFLIVESSDAFDFATWRIPTQLHQLFKIYSSVFVCMVLAIPEDEGRTFYHVLATAVTKGREDLKGGGHALPPH